MKVNLWKSNRYFERKRFGYQEIKRIEREYQNHCTLIKSQEGMLISESGIIMETWTRHYKELPNQEGEEQQNIMHV